MSAVETALTFLESATLKRRLQKTACAPVVGCSLGLRDQRTELEAMLPGKCLNYAGEGGFSCVFHDGEGVAYKTARHDEEDTKYEKLKGTPGVLAMQLHTVGKGKYKGKYYSGEMCMHGNLKEFSKNPKTTAEELAGVLKQVIPAFQSLHGAGYLHGDVKPQNMVVCDDHALKLIDYSARPIPASLFKWDHLPHGTPMYDGLVARKTDKNFSHMELWGNNSTASALVEEYSNKKGETKRMAKALKRGTLVFVDRNGILYFTIDIDELKEATDPTHPMWSSVRDAATRRQEIIEDLKWYETNGALGKEKIQELIDSHKVRLVKIETKMAAVFNSIPANRVKNVVTSRDVRAAHYAIVLCICNFYGIRLKEKSDEGNAKFRKIKETLEQRVVNLKHNNGLLGWLALANLKHVPEETMHPTLYTLMQASLKEIVRKPDDWYIPDWPFTDGEIAEAVVKRKIAEDNRISNIKEIEEIYSREYATPVGMVEFEVTQNKPAPTAKQMDELQRRLQYAKVNMQEYITTTQNKLRVAKNKNVALSLELKTLQKSADAISAKRESEKNVKMI